MRRGFVGMAALAAVLLAALFAVPLLRGAAPISRAQEVATPAATPDAAADVAALQARIAVLQAEVALLGGVDVAVISGRLGGSRASFDADYGTPTGYLDADGNLSAEAPLEGDPAQVRYTVPDIGDLTVTFTDGRATALTVTPARAADQALTEADPADWTLDQANQIGGRFAPADAGSGTLVSEQVAPAAGVEVTVESVSDALAALFPVAPSVDVETDCGPTPAPAAATPGGFTATLTYSSAEQISTLSYAVGVGTGGGEAAAAAGGSLAPTTVTDPVNGRANRGTSANVTSSLGGMTTVNGIQVQATQIRPQAEGVLTAAPDQALTAVAISIANTSGDAVTYDLPDFVLVDADGYEVAAVCGGVDPAITTGELAPGDAVEGWVTFQAPASFVPERFVFLVGNARIAFGVR